MLRDLKVCFHSTLHLHLLPPSIPCSAQRSPIQRYPLLHLSNNSLARHIPLLRRQATLCNASSFTSFRRNSQTCFLCFGNGYDGWLGPITDIDQYAAEEAEKAERNPQMFLRQCIEYAIVVIRRLRVFTDTREQDVCPLCLIDRVPLRMMHEHRRQHRHLAPSHPRTITLYPAIDTPPRYPPKSFLGRPSKAGLLR